MELIPCKIDWKKYKKDFPSADATWVLPLKARFPNKDLTGKHDAYSAAFDRMAKHLPTATKKALGVVVAGTSCNYVDSVDFDCYHCEVEYDPEEFEGLPLPHLDPRRMKRVAKALEALEAVDYETEVREAWKKGDVSAYSVVSTTMKNAAEFLAYLRLWIKAFKEIHGEGAVLGFEFA